MTDGKAATEVIPAVKTDLGRINDPLYHEIMSRSAPRKSPAEMGLDRVSFTYQDGEGNLKCISPLIWHDALNAILTILEDAEIG